MKTKELGDQQLTISNPQSIQQVTNFQQLTDIEQQSSNKTFIGLDQQDVGSTGSTSYGTSCVPERKDKKNGNSSNEQKGDSTCDLQATEFVASNFALVTLGLLVEVDAIYTGIWEDIRNNTNASDSNECQPSMLAVRWSTLGIFGVAWAVFIAVYALYFSEKTVKCLKLCEEGKWCLRVEKCCSQKDTCSCHTFLFIIVVFIIMVYPVPYLLLDNSYPLECYQETKRE